MFCDTLRKARERAGLSKAQISQALNLKYTTYDNYERGAVEPRTSTLIKIADILNISIDELVGRIPKNKNEQLQQIIESTLSFINKNNAPFTIRNYASSTNTINLSFEGEGFKNIDSIEVSKQDIIEAINTINLQIDNTRYLLLFEKLAMLGLNDGLEHCKRLIPMQQGFIKTWIYGHVKKGVTGELVSKEQIEKDLNIFCKRLEELTARQETILEYRKALQDFMNHNK